MSAFDKYPLGNPAFISHPLDRAAHFRTNDEKLFAMEGQANARAYVVYRDSLVIKQDDSGPRALLSIKEALGFGANPGTIFLGLRDGAPIFGMGMSPAAAEALVGRYDVGDYWDRRTGLHRHRFHQTKANPLASFVASSSGE